jgi:hypothetical protein
LPVPVRSEVRLLFVFDPELCTIDRDLLAIDDGVCR